MGPVKQYTSEPSDGPLTVRVYPGADGRFMLYEDDGVSFGYRAGDWMGIDLGWDDRGRKLSIKLANGSKMRPPVDRAIEVQNVADRKTRSVIFRGKAIEVRL
jgi:hypothetical protein